jgi:hypothetical protein
MEESKEILRKVCFLQEKLRLFHDGLIVQKNWYRFLQEKHSDQ